MSSLRPTVLLADDHPGVLVSLLQMLSRNFEVVAWVSDGQSALEAGLQFRPDIIVMDITMPNLNGLRVLRELKRVGITSPVIFLTVHQDKDYLNSALEAGAKGYVLKARMNSDLMVAMDEVLAGRTFFSPQALPNAP